MNEIEIINGFISKSGSVLPIHSRYWKVKKIGIPLSGISPNKYSNGVIIKTLMFKPVSTYFKLSINVREKDIYKNF